MKKILLISLLFSLVSYNLVYSDGSVIKDIVIQQAGKNKPLTINGKIVEENIVLFSIGSDGTIKNKVIREGTGLILNGTKLTGEEEVIFLDDGGILLDNDKPNVFGNYIIKYNGERVFEGKKVDYLEYKKNNFVMLDNGKPVSEVTPMSKPSLYPYYIDKNGKSHRYGLKFSNFYVLSVKNDLVYDVECKNNNLIFYYNRTELTALAGSKEIVFIRYNNLDGIRPSVTLSIDGKKIFLDKEDDITINGCTIRYNGLGKKLTIVVDDVLLAFGSGSSLEGSGANNEGGDNSIIKASYDRKLEDARSNFLEVTNITRVREVKLTLEELAKKIRIEDPVKQRYIIGKLFKGLDELDAKYASPDMIMQQYQIEYIRAYFKYYFFDLYF